jgi:Ni,Fe-hydrogenase maturation factor
MCGSGHPTYSHNLEITTLVSFVQTKINSLPRWIDVLCQLSKATNIKLGPSRRVEGDLREAFNRITAGLRVFRSAPGWFLFGVPSFLPPFCQTLRGRPIA